MKKIALLSASITALLAGSSAFADDLAVKINGNFTFEGGYLKQSNLPNADKYITANRKNIVFDTNAYVAARIETENECMKYGALLSMYTTTHQTGSTSNSADRTHVFLESDYGKIELGSTFDAGTKMRITSPTYARGAGGNTDSYARLDIKDAAGREVADQPMFTTYFLNKLDKHHRESTRKISYYTPKLGAVQIGVSYIPDTGNFGSLSLGDNSENDHMVKTYNVVNGEYKESRAIKDAISAGITIEHDFTDLTSVKLAFTQEYGKAARKGTHTDATTRIETKYKLADLSTYNIGGIVTSGNYSFVASYADLGNSLTSRQLLGKDRKTSFYNAGVIYSQGPVGISLSYFNIDRHKNKTKTYVLGTDYILAPGLQTYAEVGFFNGKGKLPAAYGVNNIRKFKGTVFHLGLNLSF